MSMRGQPVGFRRFAGCRVMRLLALLVVLLLPLHGMTSAIASIQAPAHYHLHLADQPAQSAAYAPSDDDAVLAVFDGGAHNELVGQHSRIGNHAHALDDTDVVYLDGDSDPSDPGSAGKHASAGCEAPLPGWSMPQLLTTRAQALSEPASHYRSHQVEPLLRPPSATRRSPA